ncbi:26S proteasome non-ATPase regulatory subunit 5-like [Sitophilus oryzae]|uniref:26S proteasome non-ATPase regulatory subunit 5 n=1 Tax=Sitophilus oryzae TaxID=7048 RepID=A0A6J2XMN9_SITOR|nr:26S proteasome non-ATPase regulatory subunit 5-like [Sitophilus oryzae]
MTFVFVLVVLKMASGQDWFNAKVSSLLQEDLRVSTLTELKDHLTSLPHNEASHISNVLQLALVFDCLNDTNTEQVDLACDVLSLCLSNLTLGESTIRYGNALERALIHPYSGVKLMALKEIKRSLLNEEVIYNLCDKTALVINIITCLKDEDLAVAKEASDIIFTLGITIPGANRITANEILVPLEGILNTNEVVRLRVYEAVVRICVESDYSFQKFIKVGFIHRILAELKSNDVLLKINIIEILSYLGQCDHGYVFLDQNGTLNNIVGFMNEDDLTMQLCQPGILRFFGHVAHKKPLDFFKKYPVVIERLYSNLNIEDMTVLGVSLDTIGYIGQTNEGKLALQSTGNRIEVAIKNISSKLSSLPTETRIRALNCLENLLRVVDNNNEIVSLSREWYGIIDTDPMDIILRYAKNPFSELKVAGLGILNSIAGQEWGQECIKNTPGLIEFLLDRSIESVKECKEAKYDIVKLLSQSTVFDHITSERLQTFVKEGAFYVYATTEVAIEGN